MNNDPCSKYIKDNFYPTGIVFSTEKAKNIIGKNNLQPSEFLRPFGIFPKVDFKTETYSASIKNFRLDFYDSEKFAPSSQDIYSRTIETVLSDPKIIPDMPAYNLKDRNQNYKIPDNVTNKLNNFSFPWFNEYANTIVELNRFNEYELYQQPLCFVYICSIDDPINVLMSMINQQENKPSLLYERIYDSNMPTLIIILNDKSPESPFISEQQKNKNIENFKLQFGHNYLLYWELNDNDNIHQNKDDKSLNNYIGDIWTKYLHRTELYNYNSNLSKEKGKYLMPSVRKKFHLMIYDFFNKYAIKEIQKKISYIDRYIQENKKGIKNTIFGFLKGDTQNKNRWNNKYRMYILSTSEFQEYLISTIYFYFHNYESAKEISGIFMEDIKKKSNRHYACALELHQMCSYICNSLLINKENIFDPFEQHINNKDFNLASRALFFGIKASEQRLNLKFLPSIISYISKIINNSILYQGIKNLSSIIPIILEQSSIYYLLMNPMKKRKFFINIIQSAKKYLKENYIFWRFSFYDFLFLKEFLDSYNDDSYLIAKDYISDCLGMLSQNLNFYQGSVVFYQRYIENSKFFSREKNEQRTKKILDNLNLLFNSIISLEEEKKKGIIFGDYNINDMTIPEIDNTSILVIEQQDYLISKSDNLNFFANPANWNHFEKYDYVPVKDTFLCLTPPDIMALKNLDNIILNKQNFSNFFTKRKFHMNVKNKIYIRFNINNPLPFDLNLTNMKLIIEFLNEKKDNEKISNLKNNANISTNSIILSNQEITNKENEYICENKDINLKKFSNQNLELFVQLLKEGKIIIKGVEFTLGGCANVKHYFNKKNKSKLYHYSKRKRSSSIHYNRSRSMSTSSKNSANSNNSKNSYRLHINYKENIICDVLDNIHDINIIFPLGREIEIYKDQFFLMPIKIVNNSDINIKKFCFYFNDGIHNYKENDDIKNCCYLNEVIYKEMEIDNDKNKEKIIYVPLIPRKRGDIFLKILFKYEEEKIYIDNEVQRFLIKLKIKESFNFNINESITQFLPSKIQFQLNSKCIINNNSALDNFNINTHIYLNDSYEICQNNNIQKTINKDNVIIYNKYIFNKKRNINKDDCDDNLNINKNDNEYIIKRKKQILNKKIKELEKSINFEENNFNGILLNPEQNHIKKKLCYLIAKDNLIFIWTAIDKNTNNEIKGLYIYKPNIIIPTINSEFLNQLLNHSITLKHIINKLNNKNYICTIIMSINKNIFREINDIKYFEIYVNKSYSRKYNWIGLQKYCYLNYNNNTKEETGKNNIENLEFNCLINEKGVYDLNQFSMTIYSLDPNKEVTNINKILSPIIIEIE